MFPDIGLIKIHSVYLPTALHPVLDEDELSPLFTSSKIPLWQVGDSSKDGRVNPCTIDLAKCNDQTVFVEIQWPGSAAECPVRLQGVLESGEKFSQNDSFIMPAAKKTVVVPTKLTAWSTIVPWGINSTITWTLESVSTEGGVETKCPFQSHPIQIYAVSARLPPFLSYPGIPQEVLDFFLVIIPELQVIKTFIQYAEHVVLRAICDAGSYQRAGGSTTFSDITTSAGTSDLNISKLAVDLRTQSKIPGYSFPVNCYNQGAIVQLALALGIQTPEEETKVRWHYLYPFGYINKGVALVGWGPSNNPFLPGETVVEDDAENRTDFTNHVFLSYNWKVLDATAGPATGTQTIKEYMMDSIDSEVSLYNRDKAHFERYAGQGCPSGGLLSDVINGHGLKTLSTGLAHDDIMPWGVVEFLDISDPPSSDRFEDSGYTYAFDALTEALKDIQVDDKTTWHFGEPTYNSGLRDAQWTWKTEPGSPVVDLLISISDTPTLAMNACAAYLRKVSHSLPNMFVVHPEKKIAQDSLHLVGAPGSGTGFSLWVVGRLLVVLRGLHTNDSLLPIIKTIDEHKVKGVPLFETVTMTECRCYLNSTTKLEIEIEDALDYSVRYTTGNVLVVKASKEAEGKYCFEFIGRQYGLDIVTITITNTSGHHKSHNVPVVIRDDTGSVAPKPDPAQALTSPKYSTTDTIGSRFKGNAFSSRGDIEDGLKDNITAVHVSVTKDGVHSVQPIYNSKSPASPKADDELFALEADDFITIVAGGVDKDKDVLQWIQFYTNKGHKSNVYGNKDKGTSFSWSGPKLMAFSGRGDAVVNCLRAYWLDPDSTSPSIGEIARFANSHSKVVGGDCYDMLSSDARLVVDLAGQPLTGIFVRLTTTRAGPLSAIVAQYGDVYGQTLGAFGVDGVGDRKAPFLLKPPSQWIVKITGRADEYINTIQFHTNQGRSSPEYGNKPGGEPFTLTGDRLVYLSGLGDHLHGVVALQAHWRDRYPPCCPGRDEFVE